MARPKEETNRGQQLGETGIKSFEAQSTAGTKNQKSWESKRVLKGPRGETPLGRESLKKNET